MELTTIDSTEMTDKTTTIGGNKVHLRNYNNTPKNKTYYCKRITFGGVFYFALLAECGPTLNQLHH